MLKHTVNNMKLIQINKLKIMKLSTSINYCLTVNCLGQSSSRSSCSVIYLFSTLFSLSNSQRIDPVATVVLSAFRLTRTHEQFCQCGFPSFMIFIWSEQQNYHLNKNSSAYIWTVEFFLVNFKAYFPQVGLRLLKSNEKKGLLQRGK